MTVLITLTGAGTDTGPFDLYSDLDGYVTPFETGVSKGALLGGYTSVVVPDYTTDIKIKSEGVCINFVIVNVVYPTTTTTSTAAPVTTTTTTTAGTTTTTTTAVPVCSQYESAAYEDSLTLSYIDCDGNPQAIVDICSSPPCTYTVCAHSIISSTETMFNLGPCPTTTTTTTVAPTTTTTTTLGYAIWPLSTLTDISSVVACGLLLDTFVYSALGPIAGVTVFYSDTGLTTPFVGNGDLYHILDGATDYSVSLNGSGVPSSLTAC